MNGGGLDVLYPIALALALLLLRYPSLHRTDHDLERRLDSIGNSPQSNRRWVEYAPFDAAQVCSLKSAQGAKCFLREPGGFSKFGYDDADGFALEIARLNLALATLHP